jgi:hypothetical protein
MVPWYAFDCPDCPARFEVDGRVRDELIEEGCLRCRTAVSTAAFALLRPPPELVV